MKPKHTLTIEWMNKLYVYQINYMFIKGNTRKAVKENELC